MTVKQLIEQLQEQDQDRRVVVRGYESGVDDVIRLERCKLKLHVNEELYYGDHEIDREGDTPAIEIIGGREE